MKIYLSCALTHVPRPVFGEYSQFIHDVVGALETEGHVLKYALRDSDPQLASKPIKEQARLCYIWDREMVEDADLVIAEASFPSSGLGTELQIAEQRGTPIILCFRDFGTNRALPIRYTNPDNHEYQLQIGHGFVSLMILGMPSIISAIEYRDPDDGMRQVKAAVSLVAKPGSA